MGRLFFNLLAVFLLALQAGSVTAAGPPPITFDVSLPSSRSKKMSRTGFFQVPAPRCFATEKFAAPILWASGQVAPVSIPALGQSCISPYPLSRQETFLRFGNRARDKIFDDFEHFYRRDVLANYGTFLLGTGVLANTKMDRKFQDWYQKHVRSDFTDDFSEFTRIFGEGKIFIPIVVTSACVYRFRQERFGRIGEHRPVGNFFDRTARGYAVGTPLLLTTQLTLGGNRPRSGSSYWKPFSGEDHTVSGHAFIGAVPFITAAQMSDCFLAKSAFYTLSIIPAWSRVNDDAHYLSQSLLGWYLAYLSVRAVSETEGMKPLPKGLTIFPVVESNGAMGVGLSYHR